MILPLNLFKNQQTNKPTNQQTKGDNKMLDLGVYQGDADLERRKKKAEKINSDIKRSKTFLITALRESEQCIDEIEKYNRKDKNVNKISEDELAVFVSAREEIEALLENFE